jgi:glutaconyl-CoA/methylmalonyl-CoA decarboxylase subunit gamma
MRTYELTINGKDFKVKVKTFSTDAAELEVNGDPIKVAVKNVGDDLAGRVIPSRQVVHRAPVAVSGGGAPSKAAVPASVGTKGGSPVIAPIPGAIMEVFVKEGQEIKTGQPVLKMEAMKMENVINSHADGTVLSILVRPGDAVSQGKELILIG